jgi:hypothetical protein
MAAVFAEPASTAKRWGGTCAAGEPRAVNIAREPHACAQGAPVRARADGRTRQRVSWRHGPWAVAARPAGRAESRNRAVDTRRIGPQVAAAALSVDVLNDAMRGDWRGETQPSAALDAVLGAVLGAAGITHYRGYFEAGECQC